jgi:hypothetical protein
LRQPCQSDPDPKSRVGGKVETGFPLANKRKKTRLRGDHAQTKR